MSWKRDMRKFGKGLKKQVKNGIKTVVDTAAVIVAIKRIGGL